MARQLLVAPDKLIERTVHVRPYFTSLRLRTIFSDFLRRDGAVNVAALISLLKNLQLSYYCEATDQPY